MRSLKAKYKYYMKTFENIFTLTRYQLGFVLLVLFSAIIYAISYMFTMAWIFGAVLCTLATVLVIFTIVYSVAQFTHKDLTKIYGLKETYDFKYTFKFD